jgi:sugar phosphate isomerase/epimerase
MIGLSCEQIGGEAMYVRAEKNRDMRNGHIGRVGCGKALVAAAGLILCSLLAVGIHAELKDKSTGAFTGSIWARNNLVAWCVVPFDANKRDSEDRAEMLSNLGIKHFAYDWRDKDIPTFDAEIDALQRHGIQLTAWWFPYDAEDPGAKATLETFKRHNVHPQLWVMQSPHPHPDEKGSANGAATPEAQERHVQWEANRIAALDKLAAPYGSKVALYNHNGWFGKEENQLAILDRLHAAGIRDVGMVYNFSHARDSDHDDTKNFPAIWAKIKDYVVAVNVTGIDSQGRDVYPSQGDSDLALMRVVQQSGWRGPVGIIAERGGDAQDTLHNYILGLEWAAAEINKSGSGGKPPFPPAN